MHVKSDTCLRCRLPRPWAVMSGHWHCSSAGWWPKSVMSESMHSSTQTWALMSSKLGYHHLTSYDQQRDPRWEKEVFLFLQRLLYYKFVKGVRSYKNRISYKDGGLEWPGKRCPHKAIHKFGDKLDFGRYRWNGMQTHFHCNANRLLQSRCWSFCMLTLHIAHSWCMAWV